MGKGFKRFLAIKCDYDDLFYRIGDSGAVEKSLEDFYDEEEEYYLYYDFIHYLQENDAFLTDEEVVKLLNKLSEENKCLREENESLNEDAMNYEMLYKQQLAINNRIRYK